MNHEKAIAHTKKWIQEVVIGCNFCPFAAREYNKGTIHFEIADDPGLKSILEIFVRELQRLEERQDIETTLIILVTGFSDFNEYLNLVDTTEKLLKKENYEGVYQVASFHPHYILQGSTEDDPANFTNRSPYAMLHLLREDSISKAVDKYPDASSIPLKNIEFARQKGLAYMQSLRSGSFE